MPDLQRPDGLEPWCVSCKRTPAQLGLGFLAEEGQDANDYVWAEEGTLDRATGAFLCDQCYIRYGMPIAPGAHWKATPENITALALAFPDFGTWRPFPEGDDHGLDRR